MWALALLWVPALWPPAAMVSAQEPPAPPAPPSPTARADRPRFDIQRTDVPPVIDGELDDEVWKMAPQLGPLRQVNPVEGADPSQRTEVRMLFDSHALYIAVRCYDTHPDRIVAHQMERDADLSGDDRINLVFDTFDSRRSAFFFQMNARGAKGDALIEAGPRFIRDWNGIWNGKSAIDDLGWRLEMAIPFKTINFDPASATWGFNVGRRIRYGDEEDRWADVNRNVSIIDIGNLGELIGLTGLEQGLGLDLKPFSAITYTRNRETDNNSTVGTPGGDIFYNFTPELTGVLTFNSDFSEAPVDDAQINLSRFALFFPETRDFFLQDAGIFDFGGIQVTEGLLFQENGLPFFSRRIGITDEIVKLRAGAKLTGRLGPWNLGLLDVQMAPYGDVDGKNLFVGRVALNVLEESSVGAIVTNGDPNSNDNNALYGVDFRYRDSDFRGDKTLSGDLWFQRTNSEGLHQDPSAFGAQLDYPNDIWNWTVRYAEFEENYNPALGFLARADIREYTGRLRYRVRPQSWLRTIDTQVTSQVFTNRSNNLESAYVWVDPLDLHNNAEDRLRLRWTWRAERPDAPFDIVDVTIPADDYTWNRASVLVETSPSRPVGFDLDVGWGQYYDGTRFDLIAGLQLRPSPHFNAELEWNQNDIRVDTGDVTTRLVRLRLNANFTPDLSWNTIIQYENVNDTVGLNSRIRWIVQPGDEIFLVVNHGFLVLPRNGASSVSERVTTRFNAVTFKAVYTFRF